MSEELDGSARAQHLANELGLGLGVGLLRPRTGELRVDVAELLGGKRGVVGTDEEIGFGAERLHLGFCIRDLLAHPIDLAGEPFAGVARLVLLRRLLALEIGVGDGVGDARGKLRILGQEVDDDDPRFLHRINGEPVVVGFEHALLRRHPRRILDDADRAEHGLDRGNPVEHRIEFGILVELELGDHFAGEVARQDELRLARHRFLVDGAAIDDVLVHVRTQEDVVAGFDEHARFGEIFGRDQLDDAERHQRGEDRRAQDLPFLAPQRRAKPRQVELRIDERPSAHGPSRLRRHAHFATPRTEKCRPIRNY